MVKMKIRFIILSLPKRLLIFIRYINKGKKMRSKLMYETAKIIDISANKILVSAACLEILHTASIIHDDVIDGDYLRRGEKTLNNIFSWKQATMIGNYLLLQNFQKLFRHHTYNFSLRNSLINSIETLCNGEILQGLKYNNFHKPPSLKECEEIAKKKTGTLFGLSCKIPFLLGGFSAQQIVFAQNCGLTYGVIYQIIDDLQDMVQDLEFNDQEVFFKHWTMPFIFWQERYPENFLEVFKKKKILLTDKMLIDITQQCLNYIQTLLKKLKKESQNNFINKKFYNFILTCIEDIAKSKSIPLECRAFYN